MKYLSSLCLIAALSSCAGGWTEDDKKQMRASCMEQAQRQLPDAKARAYCDCFTEQIVKTYPVFNDLTEHMQSDTVERLKAHCRQEIGLP